jgi:hypothetical protein
MLDPKIPNPSRRKWSDVHDARARAKSRASGWDSSHAGSIEDKRARALSAKTREMVVRVREEALTA